MSDKTHVIVPSPMDRLLTFSEDVNQESVEKLTRSLLEINESDAELKKLYAVYDMKYTPKPIKIYIDSYGGYVYQIFGVISIIEKSKTPVHTIVTGCAMSCGFLLLIHGHKRFAYPNSTVLYHTVAGGAHGKVQEMTEDVAEIKRLHKMIEKMTLEKTGITPEKLEKVKKRKIDWYISSAEALKLRIVDEIM